MEVCGKVECGGGGGVGCGGSAGEGGVGGCVVEEERCGCVWWWVAFARHNTLVGAAQKPLPTLPTLPVQKDENLKGL